ncbi:MAG: hypothetical protein SXA11_07685 [Cyanobacteriota bacterium]|nr:hypothetical protein [Cyanobacteriota bacterium]
MEQIDREATDEKTPPARLRELAKINPAIASLVANNPNAEPELLRELAGSEEDFIRKNVAANPNTPKEVLWWLGEKFPTEVLDNAVFPLLLLENPNLIENIPQNTMINFLQCSTVPISFMEWAVKIDYSNKWALLTHWRERVGLSLAMNGQTPRTILEELVRSENTPVAEVAELHVNYAGEIEEDWQEEFRYQMARWLRFLNGIHYPGDIGDSYFFSILASIGLVPQFLLELLVRDWQVFARYLAASTNALSVNLLEELGRDSQPEVRGAVARNPNAPAELLELLALDESLGVRSGVAENVNAPPKVLEELARDKQSEVRGAVAKNPNAPAYLLEELARDPGIFITVASNPNAPKSVFNCNNLEPYNLERYQRLKMILAANPNTPVEILEKLEGNLEKCACSHKISTREALASHPKIPENVIHLLAEDRNSRVRKALAANPQIPYAVLLRLWRDRSFLVRTAVATNPKAPLSILEEGLSELLGDRTVDVKPVLLRYLREKPEGLPVLLELIFKEISTEPSDLNPTIALLHPQMPPEVLAENGRSLVWPERCAIAQNPNTPIETLQVLAADGNRIVRAAAKENLERKFNT